MRVRATKPSYKEPDSEEYFPVFSDFSKLDLKFLERFNAFNCFCTQNYLKDFGSVKKEYIDEEKKKLKPLYAQPDAFPIKLKPTADLKELQGIDWSNLTYG